MKILRVAIAAAGALALLVQIAAVQAQTEWRQFQPSGAGYRIEFPGAPTVKKYNMPGDTGPPNLKAELTTGGFRYSVDVLTYETPNDAKATMDSIVDTFTHGRKILAQAPVKISGAIAHRFEIELTHGEIVATMLMVADGKHLYSVTCSTLTGKQHLPNVSHFINSFALVQ